MSRAPMQFYVTSFIAILHFVSDDLIQCDASTTIAEIFCDEFDDVDFELAICCFEATYRVAFEEKLWQTEPPEYEELSLEEFLETYLNPAEQKDPLFVTKRFLMFQESLTNALTDEREEPGDEY